MISRIVVVLPDPLRPRKPVSPASSRRLTSNTPLPLT